MKSLFRPFPLPLSNRQWFYLLVLQGVGAGIIDGGANFAVAYAMYHNQKIIKMWVLSKNTLAGDLGVTPIIQCLASMLITSTLVHTDLHHHAVAPLPFVWPHVEHLPDPREIIGRWGKGKRREGEETEEKKPTDEDEEPGTKSLSYYIKMSIRFIFEGTENNSLLPIGNSKPFPIRIFLTAAQGAAIGIIFGLPVFLLFIIVLGPLYKHDNIVEVGWKWSPMVIKCVYGAVVGWITNPVIASLALGSQAEHHLIIISEDSPAEGDVEAGQSSVPRIDGVGVDTIHEEEEEEYLSPPPPLTGDSLRVPIPKSPTPASGGSLRLPSSPRMSNRPRALSNISATSSLSNRMGIRPPLMANCSNIPIASNSSIRRGSVTSIPRTPRSPGTAEFGSMNLLPLDTPTLGMGSQRIKRSRGATISTYVSQSDSVNTNYSYALGGTGGRAKRPNRPRAISSLSGKGIQPPKVQVDGMEGQAGNSASEEMRLDVPSAITATTETSQVGKNNVRGNGGFTTTPVWDVFGQVKVQDQITTPKKNVQDDVEVRDKKMKQEEDAEKKGEK
ncbi:hypothetical protein L486_06547 [Kwoniella mangroviensis CBS 10435]|uniref:Uncharacterized protein n=1 Tax=Kwoniella mangroviensis CBS 10435 TaxID=1331196 RepID=A0A1B9IJS3_9TREE|nr:hypothetical protein L486_06547 [Kwoniella mangroviensis CBS 10435]